MLGLIEVINRWINR